MILDKFFNRKRQTVPEDSARPDSEIYDLNFEKPNLFLDSLEELTADDIAPEKPKVRMTTGDILVNLIRYAIVAVCLVIFFRSAADIVRNFIDYRRGDELYSEISNNIFNTDLAGDKHAVALSPSSKKLNPISDYYTAITEAGSELVEEDDEGEYNIRFQQMKANLTYLRSLNPDIYGYIHIEGTEISYPIVKGEDNDFYLDHDYLKNYMVVGSIFADYRAMDSIESDRNTVFYGHNVRSGDMFNNVTKFLDEEFFNSTVIEIYTFEGIYTFEPFAIFDTIDTYQYFRMSFGNDADFVSFCEEMQSQSHFNKNMTFNGADHIITLSTCENDLSNHGRYALHAKLVKVEK